MSLEVFKNRLIGMVKEQSDNNCEHQRINAYLIKEEKILSSKNEEDVVERDNIGLLNEIDHYLSLLENAISDNKILTKHTATILFDESKKLLQPVPGIKEEYKGQNLCSKGDRY